MHILRMEPWVWSLLLVRLVTRVRTGTRGVLGVGGVCELNISPFNLPTLGYRFCALNPFPDFFYLTNTVPPQPRFRQLRTSPPRSHRTPSHSILQHIPHHFIHLDPWLFPQQLLRCTHLPPPPQYGFQAMFIYNPSTKWRNHFPRWQRWGGTWLFSSRATLRNTQWH